MFSKIRKSLETQSGKKILIKCALSLALVLVAFGISKVAGKNSENVFDVFKAISLVLYFVAYLLVGHGIILFALANLIKGQIQLDFLIVTVGTLLCILLGQYIPAILIMMIFYLGEKLSPIIKSEKKSGENK